MKILHAPPHQYLYYYYYYYYNIIFLLYYTQGFDITATTKTKINKSYLLLLNSIQIQQFPLYLALYSHI